MYKNTYKLVGRVYCFLKLKSQLKHIKYKMVIEKCFECLNLQYFIGYVPKEQRKTVITFVRGIFRESYKALGMRSS